MASRKKPAPKKATKCALCGNSVEGVEGDICRGCRGTAAAATGARRVAEMVKNRVHGDVNGGFICPFCRCELSWENIKTSEIEVTIYVREKIYYCPGCRAFLGVSSWHTEG
ncbi:MAG TPA: hypothetical protein VE981_01795 [Planctomycetota bacterium]|nr:hypothetical protein [Planctomycetota bacterium]